MAADNERFLKLFQTTECRLEIEQRQLDIDFKERRYAAEEISNLFDVLVLLSVQLRKK